jgi:thioredoxin-related protein
MKILCLLLCVSLILIANEGKMLFDKHCLSCHQTFIPMRQLKENFLDANNSLLKLKAPTLNQLSYRLKQRIGDPKGDEDIHRMEVIAFMSDYVYYPDKDKSVCLDDVMQYFNTMPSLKGKVSEEALEEIGMYLYAVETKVKQTQGLNYEGFENALVLAKKEHKTIIIKAMSKECHFCRKMEKEVMQDEEIIQEIKKNFILLSIDVSQQSLPLGLKVELTPTFIFINAKSKVLMNVPGAWNKKDFIALLKEIQAHTQKDKK